MKHIFSIALLCILIACTTSKQTSFKETSSNFENLPKLTYEQMLEDHDSLVSYIKQVSPIVYFNKEVRGIDFDKLAKQLRSEISSNTSIVAYLRIVNKTINSAQDGHSSILRSWQLDLLKNNWIPEGVVTTIDTSDIKYGYNYDSFLKNNFHAKVNLDLIYTSGEYYNMLPFSYNGKKFPAAMKVVSCNNTEIHQFVKNLTTLVTPLKWDRENQRTYFERFYSPLELYNKDSIFIEFRDNVNTKYKLNIAKNDTVAFSENKHNQFGYNDIKSPVNSHFFEKEGLFYARLPSMVEELGDSLANRLKAVINEHEVKSIVIDIRGNGGGSDNTYNNFLKHIIKDTLKVNLTLARNFSPYNQKSLEIYRDTIAKYDHLTFNVKDVATLKEPEMFYIVQPNYQFVVPDSIKYPFNGNIYILQDRFIYSSASNLSSLAKNSSKLISIGETPNLLGGIQTDPTVLILPYSKIIFRIEPQIDLTNTKKTEDIFQNYVEYPVNYTIEQIYKRITTKEDLYSKQFLLNNDPMFRKALELEKLKIAN